MSDRLALYRRFADRFHAGKRIRPATEPQVEAAESALGVLWPESYRQFALACGALSTPKILDLVVDQKPGYSDVQDFLTPRQVVEWTKRTPLEPPELALVLAGDCGGNFDTSRSTPPRERGTSRSTRPRPGCTPRRIRSSVRAGSVSDGLP